MTMAAIILSVILPLLVTVWMTAVITKGFFGDNDDNDDATPPGAVA